MPLKKFIRITLVDKTIVDIDLKDSIRLGLEAHPPALGFNAPVGDPFFTRIAQNIVMCGLMDDVTISDTYVKFVSPSQIKNVEIIFENAKLEFVKK